MLVDLFKRPPELSLILRHNLKAFRKLVGNEPSFFHWRHLGACQRCFVWRMPFLGRFASHVSFVWGILLRDESVSQWLLIGGDWQPGVYVQICRKGNRAKFS